MRAETKKENEDDIKEAETALSGVKSALEVIKQFYSANAENEVAEVKLLQQTPKGPAADAPDAGFKNYEASKGAQAVSTGIVGMLEVIIGDFERTIRETKAEEKENTEQHTKFLGETEISVSKKTKAKEYKTKLSKDTKDKISDDSDKLAAQIVILNAGITELKSHDEECGSGATYEQRKASRAAEIESLKEAVEFIDEFMLAK